MTHEEEPVVSVCSKTIDVIFRDRLVCLRLHLDESALTVSGLLHVQINVSHRSAHADRPLPARACEDEVGKGLEVDGMQASDHFDSDGDQTLTYLAGSRHDRLFDAINAAREICFLRESADRRPEADHLGQLGAQGRDAERSSVDIRIPPRPDRRSDPHAPLWFSLRNRSNSPSLIRVYRCSRQISKEPRRPERPLGSRTTLEPDKRYRLSV